jgi:beta-aspartyl-peptidase (threonine type)
MPVPLVIVHGGATEFDEENHKAILAAVQRAAHIGFCTIENGGSALDAVESAIWQLEETTLFTAGRGARPNSEGEIELDAMVMDGNRLQSGAVMAIKGVVHPISLARYILERTNNSQFAADGAKRIYDKMVREGYRQPIEPGSTLPPLLSQGCDTVGAAAIDSSGRIVGGSSTSGWSGKLPGRIGDSPIIGAGVYANDVAAASCTGRGEQILRIVMARMAVHHIESGMTTQQAVETVMRELREKTAGEAGLIMIDKNGNVGVGFDTKHMPVAINGGDKIKPYSSMRPVWP